jgi:hypothetical protein
VDPHFLEIVFVLQLHVVDLPGLLPEHENYLLPGNQVLRIAPLHVKVIGAVVLALDVDEQNAILLKREGRNVAIVNASVLASVEYLLTALVGDSNVHCLPLVLLGQVEVEKEVFLLQLVHLDSLV